MIEAHVQIDDELAVKGFKRALRAKAIKDISHYYATNLMIVWMVIAVADVVLGAAHLMFSHFLVMAGLWIVASVAGYYDWTKRIAQTKGWSFDAKLDEQGVIINASQKNRVNWDHYTGYKEYDDYLQIEAGEGEISFLPKTPELFEVIEFTKQMISRK
jgi:hypothetical protein